MFGSRTRKQWYRLPQKARRPSSASNGRNVDGVAQQCGPRLCARGSGAPPLPSAAEGAGALPERAPTCRPTGTRAAATPSSTPGVPKAAKAVRECWEMHNTTPFRSMELCRAQKRSAARSSISEVFQAVFFFTRKNTAARPARREGPGVVGGHPGTFRGYSSRVIHRTNTTCQRACSCYLASSMSLLVRDRSAEQ